MGKLLAFRHGEAVVNRPDLFVRGQADRTFPLTDMGTAQAREIGRWARRTFVWVRAGAYTAATSQFIRAQQTYRAMDLPGPAPHILAGLNEQDWGDFMNPAPPEWLRPAFDADYEARVGARPPHGEATLDLLRRLRDSLDALVGLESRNLLLVTHGRTLLVLRMLLESVPATDAGWRFMRRTAPEMPNCGCLYYPQVRLPWREDGDSGGSVAVVNPPYGLKGSFPQRPYLGVSFAQNSL